MTETAGAGPEGVARLDELAEVTREYAKYANERTGLAGVVAGAWLVATFVIALRSETWGRAAALWAPLVTLVALVIGRRRYQRRGVIIPSGDRRLRSGRWTWWVALVMALATGNALQELDLWTHRGDLARVVVWLGVSSAPLVPLLYDRILGGTGHRAIVYGAVADVFATTSIGGHGERVGWIFALLMLGAFALAGLIVAGVGVVEHRQFGRLERRLAALWSRAP